MKPIDSASTRADVPGRLHKPPLSASFRYALEGLCYVITYERNARIHLLAAALVIGLSVWLDITRLEWALIIIAIALVFAGEMLNTVVELIIDMITLAPNPLAKHAKDVAAGAILVSSFAAATMGLVILLPHLLQKLGLG